MRRQRRANVICICLRHETVLLFSMSCDWATVKNVVPGNSSTKPDQTGGDGKGVKQSKCLITLYIVGWVIIKTIDR